MRPAAPAVRKVAACAVAFAMAVQPFGDGVAGAFALEAQGGQGGQVERSGHALADERGEVPRWFHPGARATTKGVTAVGGMWINFFRDLGCCLVSCGIEAEGGSRTGGSVVMGTPTAPLVSLREFEKTDDGLVFTPVPGGVYEVATPLDSEDATVSDAPTFARTRVVVSRATCVFHNAHGRMLDRDSRIELSGVVLDLVDERVGACDLGFKLLSRRPWNVDPYGVLSIFPEPTGKAPQPRVFQIPDDRTATLTGNPQDGYLLRLPDGATVHMSSLYGVRTVPYDQAVAELARARERALEKLDGAVAAAEARAKGALEEDGAAPADLGRIRHELDLARREARERIEAAATPADVEKMGEDGASRIRETAERVVREVREERRRDAEKAKFEEARSQARLEVMAATNREVAELVSFGAGLDVSASVGKLQAVERCRLRVLDGAATPEELRSELDDALSYLKQVAAAERERIAGELEAHKRAVEDARKKALDELAAAADEARRAVAGLTPKVREEAERAIDELVGLAESDVAGLADAEAIARASTKLREDLSRAVEKARADSEAEREAAREALDEVRRKAMREVEAAASSARRSAKGLGFAKDVLTDVLRRIEKARSEGRSRLKDASDAEAVAKARAEALDAIEAIRREARKRKDEELGIGREVGLIEDAAEEAKKKADELAPKADDETKGKLDEVKKQVDDAANKAIDDLRRGEADAEEVELIVFKVIKVINDRIIDAIDAVDDVPAPDAPFGKHLAYVNGFPDGSFRPLEGTTRAEVAKMVAVALRLPVAPDGTAAAGSGSSTDPETAAPAFSDVDGAAWFAPYVAAVAERGYMKGDAAGTFRPHARITRAEMVQLLHNLCRATGRVLPEPKPAVPGDPATRPFVDVPQDHWAHEAVYAMRAAGYANGYLVAGRSFFRPWAGVNRAETVAFMNRFLGRTTDAHGIAVVGDVPRFTDVADPAAAWYFYDVLEASVPHTFDRPHGSVLETWTRLLKREGGGSTSATKPPRPGGGTIVVAGPEDDE